MGFHLTKYDLQYGDRDANRLRSRMNNMIHDLRLITYRTLLDIETSRIRLFLGYLVYDS